LDEKDPRWMKACLDKFIWINQIHKLCPKDQELNPRDYALMSDEDHMEQKTDLLVKEKEDKLRVELDTRNETEKVISYYKQTLIDDYDKDFNWRDLFIKLVFEQML
jgi:predicted metal-binding transcription factor (methanogenesis marker protein 9)